MFLVTFQIIIMLSFLIILALRDLTYHLQGEKIMFNKNTRKIQVLFFYLFFNRNTKKILEEILLLATSK